MDELIKVLVTTIVFAAAVGIYFLPSIVAGKRNHHQGTAIFFLNLFLGWTFLGWLACLIWAVTAVKRI